jgi:HKD family nuclease
MNTERNISNKGYIIGITTIGGMGMLALILKKMDTEIISNITRNNHNKRLLDNFIIADEIIIVSPFISTSFDFFPFEKVTHLKKITMVTTLKPKDKDQYTKVPFFKKLYEFTNINNIDLNILIENSLHGKIYITKKETKYLEAIITSANFTKNGLRLNNEWGTIIKNPEKISELEDGILSRVVLKSLSESEIDDFISVLNKNPLPKEKGNEITVDLTKKIELKDNPLLVKSSANYWLKPIGVSDDIISWDRKFEEIDSDLHFSKLRPRGVKKDDILISYAVGHKNILSIYKVKSDIKYTGNKDDRWPYYIVGENLTPFYGSEWNNQGITISNQKNEVLNSGKFNITPSGKNSFGSLMRGADKLKITPEFGQFLINKIVNIENELKTKANNV